MIIFLYGEDSYRSKEKLDEIIRQYQQIHKSGLNLSFIDAKETDMLALNALLKNTSMFVETKLVIVKNVFAGKQFQEDFLEHIKHLQSLKDVVVVYEGEGPDQRLKLCKTLLKEGKCQEFASLDAKNMKAWAQIKLEAVGGKMNNDALDLLVNYVGADSWRLASELQKLANFKQGLVIKKEDVQLMVGPNIETDIFKTIDALAEKNTKQALVLLHKHSDGDESPLYILSMIAYQFRNLLMVKELSEKGLMYASIIKKSGLHPFVVKKTYFQCRQFSFVQLQEIYRKIFAIDSDIKVGKIDPETALDLLVSQI